MNSTSILKIKKPLKSVDGADTKALHHYALHTLQTSKPEIVKINIGLNNIKKDKPITIAEDIISLATVCKSYGVQKVFVSGITPRYSYQTNINELNNILEGKQVEYGYFFIKNVNVLAHEHLWRDKVHLNDAGLDMLANNFLDILNDDGLLG